MRKGRERANKNFFLNIKSTGNLADVSVMVLILKSMPEMGIS